MVSVYVVADNVADAMKNGSGDGGRRSGGSVGGSDGGKGSVLIMGQSRMGNGGLSGGVVRGG